MTINLSCSLPRIRTLCVVLPHKERRRERLPLVNQSSPVCFLFENFWRASGATSHVVRVNKVVKVRWTNKGQRCEKTGGYAPLKVNIKSLKCHFLHFGLRFYTIINDAKRMKCSKENKFRGF
jgi:hypothetical protein